MMRVMVAMSGGVDSSVAALLLRDAGHDVAGVTMRFDITFPDGFVMSLGEDAVRDAAQVCGVIGIPHHVLDLSADFMTAVVDPFVSEYFAALTPNPCVFCNRRIKFGALMDFAAGHGYDHFATGHYAAIVSHDGSLYLKRDPDSRKDQTYFLWGITPERLNRVIFPLAGMQKDAIRGRAAAAGLSVAAKGDSQDICFMAGTDYRAFLSRWADAAGKVFPPGDFVDEAGTVLGRHRGIFHYTPGQRRGLGIAHAHPLHVIAIDPVANRVVLGPKESLLAAGCSVRDIVQYGDCEGEGLVARVRYSQKGVGARVSRDGATFVIRFDEPVDSIAPGQSAVLYRDDFLIAGGVISSVIPVK